MKKGHFMLKILDSDMISLDNNKPSIVKMQSRNKNRGE